MTVRRYCQESTGPASQWVKKNQSDDFGAAGRLGKIEGRFLRSMDRTGGRKRQIMSFLRCLNTLRLSVLQDKDRESETRGRGRRRRGKRKE